MRRAVLAVVFSSVAAAQTESTVPPEWGAGKSLGDKIVLEATDVCADASGRVVVLATSRGFLELFNAGKPNHDLFYFGDKTTLAASLTRGQSGELYDPRQNAEVKLVDGACEVRCGERVVKLPRLPDEQATPLLLGARYVNSPHTHQPHALLRDSTGRYYFVDRRRAEGQEKSFRLFVGPKGAMTLQKMTNAVSDSEGEIFTTRAGDLRLVIDRQKTSEWVQGGKKTVLREVPLAENLRLIYNELGVYSGERLGNPCDDF